jgi:hypothetical protein
MLLSIPWKIVGKVKFLYINKCFLHIVKIVIKFHPNTPNKFKLIFGIMGFRFFRVGYCYTAAEAVN